MLRPYNSPSLPEASELVILSAAGAKDLLSRRRGEGSVAPPPQSSASAARAPSGPSLAASPRQRRRQPCPDSRAGRHSRGWRWSPRSEEHTSELQSRLHLVCRLLLEKKKM